VQRTIVSSFNHYSIKLVKMLDPSAKTGVLYSEAMIDPHIYAQHLEAEAIHPRYTTLKVSGTIEGC
jgi:glycerophosphoryl diester phosphodiesterase